MPKKNTETTTTKAVEHEDKKQKTSKGKTSEHEEHANKQKKNKTVEESEKKQKTKNKTVEEHDESEKKQKTSKNKTTEEPVEEHVKKLNKDTLRSGNIFDVNKIKTWIKEFCSQYQLPIKAKRKTEEEEHTKKGKKSTTKNEEHDKTSSVVKVRNVHMVLGALEQALIVHIVNTAYTKSNLTKPKESAGMYLVTEQQLRTAILTNKCLKFAFEKDLEEYNDTKGASYMKDYGVSREDLRKYVEHNGFAGGNTNVQLEDKGYSFIAFLLLQHRTRVISSALSCAEYATKATIDERSVLVQLKYSQLHIGELQKVLLRKVEETIVLLEQSAKSKKEDKTDEKKTSKNKKNESKSDKENDSESDDENESDEENESDDENESDEENESDGENDS
jgi:hypothetical protein